MSASVQVYGQEIHCQVTIFRFFPYFGLLGYRLVNSRQCWNTGNVSNCIVVYLDMKNKYARLLMCVYVLLAEMRARVQLVSDAVASWHP